jgi:hypothetical protein
VSGKQTPIVMEAENEGQKMKILVMPLKTEE